LYFLSTKLLSIQCSTLSVFSYLVQGTLSRMLWLVSWRGNRGWKPIARRSRRRMWLLTPRVNPPRVRHAPSCEDPLLYKILGENKLHGYVTLISLFSFVFIISANCIFIHDILSSFSLKLLFTSLSFSSKWRNCDLNAATSVSVHEMSSAVAKVVVLFL
jgi:hypothetical protein